MHMQPQLRVFNNGDYLLGQTEASKAQCRDCGKLLSLGSNKPGMQTVHGLKCHLEKNATKISIHCTWGKWNPVNKDHLQKRRNWMRYWLRIVGLTWWLNVWKRKKTLILSGDFRFRPKWMSIFVFGRKWNFIFVSIFVYDRKWKMLFGRPLVYNTKRSCSWDAMSWSWSWTLGLVLVLVLNKVLITSLNSKSYIINRSMSVSMILSYRERHAAICQNFLKDLHNHADTVWCRIAEFSMVTQVGKKHVLGVSCATFSRRVFLWHQSRAHPKGAGTQRPKTFKYPAYAQTVWVYVGTKFCMVTRGVEAWF